MPSLTSIRWLRPVHGHHKQGASYGHTKIASKQVLRKGLSPLVTLSTDTAAPVITAEITVRGDSAYGPRAVIRVCHRYGPVFSLARNRSAAVQRAIDAIGEDAWTPVRYPGAVRDRETGAWATTSCMCHNVFRRPGAGGGHPAPHDHRG